MNERKFSSYTRKKTGNFDGNKATKTGATKNLEAEAPNLPSENNIIINDQKTQSIKNEVYGAIVEVQTKLGKMSMRRRC